MLPRPSVMGRRKSRVLMSVGLETQMLHPYGWLSKVSVNQPVHCSFFGKKETEAMVEKSRKLDKSTARNC